MGLEIAMVGFEPTSPGKGYQTPGVRPQAFKRRMVKQLGSSIVS